ncbi:LysR family transcriptional regulator [Vibrio fluvialis]|uniref:LysR family transcriptional regulator n=1 Tax=Vibrio fluvialis TaxID=676 RepID=UPI0005097ADF|nr:LysR family transcriptional regulator [Vibrio fluvialis]EKO3484709.1 LysR family transcriptional regulator [Vibrio fluvialis]ELI5731780.1 LysR family transcriptional regulator [Vibrio fluvialis]MBY7896087.1 LysR family transcriptional regulator [Vibrio fluvialis]MBY7974191.1 LysR family transcriptional regulator [Vibrio fluvialis]MBY8085595.1 LysR family transcriptional regulator [Vibrio fluvialis]
MAFIAAAEQGSFSAAARHLKKSQSSVSIGVNNLELDLGVELFDRTTKYPTLTPQGRRVLEQAKLLVRQAERIRNYCNANLAELEDNISIGVDPLIPLESIDTALCRLIEEYPFVQVKIERRQLHDLHQCLIEGKLDLGFCIPEKGMPKGLEFVTVMDVEFVYVCSPDSKMADMELVTNETLISERQIICSNLLENNLYNETAIVSQDTWQANNMDDVIRLVEQGIGWGIIPNVMYKERLESGTLVKFEPEYLKYDIRVEVDALWPLETELGPIASNLIAIMQTDS